MQRRQLLAAVGSVTAVALAGCTGGDADTGDSNDGDGDTEAMSVDATDVQDALGLPDEAIPDDLQDRLDRIEAGVREATNAAQSADKKLEGLGR